MSSTGRLGLGAALCAVAMVATLSPQPAVGRATHQTFVVPASGAFSFEGHGYGHGHGMSQYGAQGAAIRGLSAHAILSFYYPGTRRVVESSRIRVLITSDTTRDVQVLAQPGLTLTDRGSDRTYPLPDLAGVRRWRLNVSHGRAVVGYLSHAWHRYTLPGDLTALVGDGQFRAREGRALTLITPSGQLRLRGAVRAASPGPGGGHADRDTVNVLGIDNYVKGVVPREMPTSWRPAAVRAQAIAARTYALYERAHNRSRYYDLCDTVACQVYGGVAAQTSAGNAAVKATARTSLTWHGQPAFTQFSASNGGRTVAGGLPYLPAEPDPYDGWSGNPFHTWEQPAKAKVLQRRYPALGRLLSITITERSGGGQWGGQVRSAQLVGSKGTVTVSGSDIRMAYGLRTTWFMPK